MGGSKNETEMSSHAPEDGKPDVSNGEVSPTDDLIVFQDVDPALAGKMHLLNQVRRLPPLSRRPCFP